MRLEVALLSLEHRVYSLYTAAFDTYFFNIFAYVPHASVSNVVDTNTDSRLCDLYWLYHYCTRIADCGGLGGSKLSFYHYRLQISAKFIKSSTLHVYLTCFSLRSTLFLALRVDEISTESSVFCFVFLVLL